MPIKGKMLGTVFRNLRVGWLQHVINLGWFEGGSPVFLYLSHREWIMTPTLKFLKRWQI